MSEELKKIKKLYGENFMKLCRELFPTILEKEGKLLEILQKSFATNSRNLYEDITKQELVDEFKDYIYSKIDVESEEKNLVVGKTPYELLDEAGYNLFECESEEEIQSFKKYYAPGEELCTFKGGRLNRCVVFFAVKKDVDNIKRENFEKPQREDEYGTSVMGIQFNKKGKCTVSIKNRYNHTVNNPDATYGNDLDRISYGLTQSFGNLLKERGMELSNANIERFEIQGYTVANDGKYYKYNYEINGIYYCPGNVTIENGRARTLENPEKQQLIDYFIVDSENKMIILYANDIYDSFTYDFKNIEKIDIRKNKEKGTRTIYVHQKEQEPIEIEIDNDNNIIGYKNKKIEHIGDYFLQRNKRLKKLDLPLVKKIGKGFLLTNEEIEEIDLPKVQSIGNHFLMGNEKIEKINLPVVQKIGRDFLYRNEKIEKINLTKVKEIENTFLFSNERIKEINLPEVKSIGNYFLNSNKEIEEINLPKVKEIGYDFLFNNHKIEKINLPNVQSIGDGFLYNNNKIKEISFPEVTEIEYNFLYNNNKIEEINLPKIDEKSKANLSDRIKELLNEKRFVNSNDIAKLDNDNKLTTSEINEGENIINNITKLKNKNR